ncbi:MAG TPA: glycoside hydrolase family 2 TIM barrel-domain containing protein [Clostridia bacterium]|nr:glycoside hydrolase family 2 TIM barrel-domain containing protein [Clostridia bacterium]
MRTTAALTVFTAGLLWTGLMSFPLSAQVAWQPAHGPLMTRWAADVSPNNALPDYPRPQLVRKEWQNLNGLWDVAILRRGDTPPASFNEKILVPFPVESALSGLMKTVSENDRIWYRRTFVVPDDWREQRVLLHFGAVDFETVVWVNGNEVGKHTGGYDAFSFDITDALKRNGVNELVVGVWDPTDAGSQPRGKQIRNPHGIWYTPTSGIWQTVWLEPVRSAHIQELKITPDVDAGCVVVKPATTAVLGTYTVEVTVWDRSGVVGVASGRPGSEIRVAIPKARLWSPENPFLYDLAVSLKLGSKAIDRVESYFGMRKISMGKDANGFTRILLNNKPYFQVGPLDQGFWPDGLYTAPTDEALRYDIEMTKKLGFNMARKHVKVEPARWYYWCDKLGLLVWQDMPSGDKYIGPRDPDIERTPESARQFETELAALIKNLGNHPSIVMWVPFNEGWGQYDTVRITEWVKQLDPTRLVNNTSGWSDRGVGDVNDMHKYPGPGSPEPEVKRAAVLGEFGGLGLPVRGHTWQSEKNWGYRSFTNSASLTTAYIDLMAKLFPLVEEKGLSAAVYTQTTDVEVEVNGLMTYDRALVKMPMKQIAAVNRGNVPALPKITDLVPSAQVERSTWRYTFDKPNDGWFRPSFNDGSWKQGPSGFGTRGTPGSVVRTEWKAPSIWLRREFSIPASDPAKLHLMVHHDDDAVVYINGELAAVLPGCTTDYRTVTLREKAAASLKREGNVMAVHCRQTGGGQYIDVGIVQVDPVKN